MRKERKRAGIKTLRKEPGGPISWGIIRTSPKDSYLVCKLHVFHYLMYLLL